MKKKTKNQNSDMGAWSQTMFGYTKNGYLYVNGKKRKLSPQEDNHIEDED